MLYDIYVYVHHLSLAHLHDEAQLRLMGMPLVFQLFGRKPEWLISQSNKC